MHGEWLPPFLCTVQPRKRTCRNQLWFRQSKNVPHVPEQGLFGSPATLRSIPTIEDLEANGLHAFSKPDGDEWFHSADIARRTIMQAASLLKTTPHPTDQQIDDAMQATSAAAEPINEFARRSSCGGENRMSHIENVSGGGFLQEFWNGCAILAVRYIPRFSGHGQRRDGQIEADRRRLSSQSFVGFRMMERFTSWRHRQKWVRRSVLSALVLADELDVD